MKASDGAVGRWATSAVVLLVAGTVSHAANTVAAASGFLLPPALSRAQAVLRVATSVVFIGWFYLAYDTARRARPARLPYRSGWAIAGYLVPGINLVLPYLLARDLARLGPKASELLLAAWWTAFTAGNLLWLAPGVPGAFPAEAAAPLAIWREASWAASAVLSIPVVLRLTGTR